MGWQTSRFLRRPLGEPLRVQHLGGGCGLAERHFGGLTDLDLQPRSAPDCDLGCGASPF